MKAKEAQLCNHPVPVPLVVRVRAAQGNEEGRLFFCLPKKKQKDFYSGGCGQIPAMASIVGEAGKKIPSLLFFKKEVLSSFGLYAARNP
jgi:hypothetical protein